jgi:hypothetical protein
MAAACLFSVTPLKEHTTKIHGELYSTVSRRKREVDGQGNVEKNFDVLLHGGSRTMGLSQKKRRGLRNVYPERAQTALGVSPEVGFVW